MLNEATEANAIWKALEPSLRKLIAQETKDCVRRKKAVVTTVYNSTTKKIGVKIGFSDVLLLPCAAVAQSATVGQSVIVEYAYGMTNGVVMYLGSIV
jgi:hypothetical protein